MKRSLFTMGFVALCSIGGCGPEPQARTPVADRPLPPPTTCAAAQSRCSYDSDCCSNSCMDEMERCR
jgi:hypothetical protein